MPCMRRSCHASTPMRLPLGLTGARLYGGGDGLAGVERMALAGALNEPGFCRKTRSTGRSCSGYRIGGPRSDVKKIVARGVLIPPWRRKIRAIPQHLRCLMVLAGRDHFTTGSLSLTRRELSSCDVALSLCFRLSFPLLRRGLHRQAHAEEAEERCQGPVSDDRLSGGHAAAGQTSTINLRLQNYDLPPERLALSVSGVPTGWTATLIGGGQPVAAAMPATNASVSLELRLDVPKDAPIGTHQPHRRRAKGPTPSLRCRSR